MHGYCVHSQSVTYQFSSATCRLNYYKHSKLTTLNASNDPLESNSDVVAGQSPNVRLGEKT